MFVSGDPLRSPGPRGEQQHDKSFLLWLNAQGTDCKLSLPVNTWVEAGEVVLTTDPRHRVGSLIESGSALVLSAQSLVLLRQL